MIPPVIPPGRPSEDTCPKCGKEEDIVTTCRHCGYEYEDQPQTFGQVFFSVIVVIVGIWVLSTLLWWLVVNFDNQSLWEILQAQWEWIKAIRIV